MPWNRINEDSERKVFTHPDANGWSIEEPYEGFGSDLMINPPPRNHWLHEKVIDIEVDNSNLSVTGTTGNGDFEGVTVPIPMIIICAIVDWMREHNQL